MSQERLAELAGLNYKHIGRIELAKSDPGADVLGCGGVHVIAIGSPPRGVSE